jgi:hypothetical protein
MGGFFPGGLFSGQGGTVPWHAGINRSLDHHTIKEIGNVVTPLCQAKPADLPIEQASKYELLINRQQVC